MYTLLITVQTKNIQNIEIRHIVNKSYFDKPEALRNYFRNKHILLRSTLLRFELYEKVTNKPAIIKAYSNKILVEFPNGSSQSLSTFIKSWKLQLQVMKEFG